METNVASIKDFVKKYKEEVQDDMSLTEEVYQLKRVGKQHARRQLESTVESLLNDTILQSLGASVGSAVF